MDIKQLKTFICVADCGSISRASDRLRIAQPALSRQIKLLEHEIGVPLFDRHVRGMNLTEAGTELLSRVSGLIYQLEQSVLDLKSLNEEVRGNVTIGVLPTITEMFAVKLLKRTRETLPAVTIHLREAYSVNLVEWLQAGDLDIAFLYGPPSAYQLSSIGLLHEDIVLLSPPGSLKDYGDSIHIRDIATLPLALPSRPFGPRLIVDRIAKSADVELVSIFDVDSFRVITSMVVAGYCHAFMPISSVVHLKKDGLLELRQIEPGPVNRHLILASASRRPATRAVIAVTQIIKQQIYDMTVSGAWNAQPCSELLELDKGAL